MDLLDKLPTCAEYSRLLGIAVFKFGITRDEARNKYGLYTLAQWNQLLNH